MPAHVGLQWKVDVGDTHISGSALWMRAQAKSCCLITRIRRTAECSEKERIPPLFFLPPQARQSSSCWKAA